MHIDIIDQPFRLDLHGFSGVAVKKDYVGTAFALMDKMWQIVKSNGLENKGKNIWVFDGDEKVFAGVELLNMPQEAFGLESKSTILAKYARYTHIGPYNLIKQTGLNMQSELKQRRLEPDYPYIEIYGHWTEDESRLETELLICLK